MIDEKPAGREGEADGQAAIDTVSRFFDVHAAQIAPFAWICAALPNKVLCDAAPEAPLAALQASGRHATGCGTTAAACRRSGIGEAVELVSACDWGNLPMVEAEEEELGAAAIPPEALTGFSDGQIARRDAWNRRHGAYDWRPPPRGRGPIRWIAARDAADGATVHLPADAVLIGRREAGDEAAAAIADSNGCAAGQTPDDARLAALLELVERDATGRWWYGRRRRGVLPGTVLDAQPGLRDWLCARTRVTRLVDITTDIGIPVVAAVSQAPDGGAPALGFAARPRMDDAALSATVEMLAMETALDPPPDAPHDPLLRAWLDGGGAGLPPFGPPIPAPPLGCPEGPAGRLADCIDAVRAAGCRVLFVDLTRAVFGIPVFRAVAPGLCHYKPRLGHRRLLAADPRDMGGTAGDIALPNPMPLLV